MVSSDKVVLAFDVGASWTRVSAGVLVPDGLLPRLLPRDGQAEQVSSRERLYDFVWRVLDSLPDGTSVLGATFAAAGPVEDHASLSMTNWMDTQPIRLEELVDLGLPIGTTALVNDLEAGAHGLHGIIADEGPDADGIESLHESDHVDVAGNFVFVAPGSGLGAAGLVRHGAHDPEGARGDHHMTVVPCEVQHTRLPPVDEEIARVAERVSIDSRRDWVSWEDLVSGRGLLDAYVALCSLSGLVPIASAKPPAGEEEIAHVAAIARSALEGEDTMCSEALDVYYRCLGAFCQALALTFLPCAGVFIGGDTTRKNRDFLVRSGLMKAFFANPVQGDLLRGTPVRLVLRETNLAGGLRLAERLARSAENA